ncbi:hypothetical protein ACJRPK_13935 [Aquimarina sp. 2-A2]|uniref:hypothetical protein n=1 Tax=Aquimarina sp. 2-A2 TaxID=3382644 RepID=UPI00387F2585
MKNILILLIITLVLVGCAEPTNIDNCIINSPSGFWSGLWHGMIAPISWIGSLLMDDVLIYDINNKGGWYDTGFMLGIGALSFGSSKA